MTLVTFSIHGSMGYSIMLAAQIVEEGTLKDKGPFGSRKDIQNNPCSHAIHSQLQVLTSRASYQPNQLT